VEYDRGMSYIRAYLSDVWHHGCRLTQRAAGAGQAMTAILHVLGVIVASTITWAALGYTRPDFTTVLAVGVIGWVLVAFMVIGPYLAWKGQKARADKAETFLVPKLKCSFDMNFSGCVIRDVVLQYITNVRTLLPEGVSITAQALAGYLSDTVVRADYFRLKIETNNSIRVNNCHGRLLEIECEGRSLLPEPLQLPFAPAEHADALNKTVYQNIPEYLDTIAITEANKVVIPTRKHQAPSHIRYETIFSKPSDYRLRIAVVSEGAIINGDLLFRWTGDRATSKVSYKPA
jgi:hypothetical protein